MLPKRPFFDGQIPLKEDSGSSGKKERSAGRAQKPARTRGLVQIVAAVVVVILLFNLHQDGVVGKCGLLHDFIPGAAAGKLILIPCVLRLDRLDGGGMTKLLFELEMKGLFNTGSFDAFHRDTSLYLIQIL